MQAVYEFRRRRRRISQNTQPGERIDTLIDANVALGNRWPADAMKPVATGDEITSNLAGFIVLGELYLWVLRIHVAHAHVGNFKQQRCARAHARRNEIFDDLVLPVNGNAPACQCSQVNAAAVPEDIEVDSVMEETLALKPVADAALDQEVNGGLFQHAGANAIDHIIF